MPQEQASQAVGFPTQLADPGDILGFGEGLDGDGRKRLALEETPFVVTGAEVRYFPDGREAVVLSMVCMPDSQHDGPWTTSTMVGLPKEPNTENPGDRQRLVNHFSQPNPLPVGPLVAKLVDVNQPSPYWAIRKASDKVMARYALQAPTK